MPGSLGTVAIETGTCKGNGAKALAGTFPSVFTIELSEALHRAARERLAPFLRVTCIQGDSSALLPKVLDELGCEAVFFFLDAPWSGDRAVNWAQRAQYRPPRCRRGGAYLPRAVPTCS
jgi:hypothetical protein